MIKIITGVIISLISFNITFAESGWAENWTWYETIIFFTFWIILPLSTILLLFNTIYKIIKKEKIINNLKVFFYICLGFLGCYFMMYLFSL